ncbi:hypothetical protein F8O01_15595 [Pseudoclavibacter chungangensis]|uniref:Uncharacterized protein n=1 Tax=Pseudoclavibacter chungangensis TaxID=587635 RepID=A0A7J5BN28_9MICO|nr:hypothetical protein [Pseudoclavibacter chungangensis]KAB1653285.1 hypothetical protein F8O01_15595 [Pseudoclavibacter chungangensis]NYJ66974.1 hypothetical protein [Pseudoclavibacter chungangensis]
MSDEHPAPIALPDARVPDQHTLTDLRDELDRAASLPLEERAAAYAEVHARLTAALEEPATDAASARDDAATGARP